MTKTAKKETMMCACCGLNKATIKDHRDFADQGLDYEIDCYVCFRCFKLNNYWFLKLKRAKYPIGKKRVITRIIGDNWKNWLIK